MNKNLKAEILKCLSTDKHYLSEEYAVVNLDKFIESIKKDAYLNQLNDLAAYIDVGYLHEFNVNGEQDKFIRNVIRHYYTSRVASMEDKP